MKLTLSGAIIAMLACIAVNTHAQPEKRFIKHQISILSEPNKFGRGYVRKGHDLAARYILHEMKSFGLQPVDSTYIQSYNFPVNTFPDEMSVTFDRGFRKMTLQAGYDFLVDAASNSYDADNIKVTHEDLGKIKDTTAWHAFTASLHPGKAYFFKNADTFSKTIKQHWWGLVRNLPKGLYIIPQHGKLTWDVATDTIAATALYVEDTAITHKVRRATVHIHSVLLPAGRNVNENIIACVPGRVKDSFIVFTAHYDHLGMMGRLAMFPGASDNASGTAMLLYLAQYFAKNPQRYTMVFIAFSGEEAGLLGSEYFVKHPMLPLGNIKFLVNIDIMGDATDGITVVNATEFPQQFQKLQKTNETNDYLPQIKSRGQTANSDHYYFYKAGVPSFFIYSNGGKGYYHDVFDTSSAIMMTNIDKVARLLIDFVKTF